MLNVNNKKTPEQRHQQLLKSAIKTLGERVKFVET